MCQQTKPSLVQLIASRLSAYCILGRWEQISVKMTHFGLWYATFYSLLTTHPRFLQRRKSRVWNKNTAYAAKTTYITPSPINVGVAMTNLMNHLTDDRIMNDLFLQMSKRFISSLKAWLWSELALMSMGVFVMSVGRLWMMAYKLLAWHICYYRSVAVEITIYWYKRPQVSIHNLGCILWT